MNNNFCPKCGNKLEPGIVFCPKCGNQLVNIYTTNKNDQSTPGLIVTCAIVGFLFPIIGAIMYFSLKSTAPKAAKTANLWSFIGFMVYVIIYILSIVFANLLRTGNFW